MNRRSRARTSVLAAGAGIGLGATVQLALAAGEVTSMETVNVPATPFEYSVDGYSYQWGMGNNQLLDAFVADGHRFGYASSANRVELRRGDTVNVSTGEPCGLFAERIDETADAQALAPDYPSDGSDTGNCDLSALLASRVINRGAVDLFSNMRPDAGNIERLDYIFDYGLLSPIDRDALGSGGHVMAEKSSNNPVKIAAILELDVFGNPAAYGPLIEVTASGCSDPFICYGTTDLGHSYTFLQNGFEPPQGYPTETDRSDESVGMALLPTSILGLHPGQRYYGFSVFADDVDRNLHDLSDPATFPRDTHDPDIATGDDADLYGGLSGYFLADDVVVAKGRVFIDNNADRQSDEGEPGISDLEVNVYADADGNGVFDPVQDPPMSDPIVSDLSGDFLFPALPDGMYFVVLQESDEDMPPGLQIADGINPWPISVDGNDPEPVLFAFDNLSGGGRWLGRNRWRYQRW